MTSLAALPRHWPITQLVSTLNHALPFLRERYHIDSLGVFGSYVRNVQRGDSDLDVLVSFSKTPTLFTLVQLEDELSTLLGVPVDLTLKHSLRPRIAQRVLQEVIEL